MLVPVEAEKERHRIAILRRVVEDTMHRRLETVVGKSHEKVSDIDDEFSRNWWDIQPLPLPGKDLESADLVLPEESKALQVCMRTEANVNVCTWNIGALGIVVKNPVTDDQRQQSVAAKRTAHQGPG